MALVLASNNFKEGETLKMDHILSADYGFGCGGGNKSPHALPVNADTSAAVVGFNLHFSTIEKASLTGKFSR
mgnify:CR=1 FL=1